MTKRPKLPKPGTGWLMSVTVYFSNDTYAQYAMELHDTEAHARFFAAFNLRDARRSAREAGTRISSYDVMIQGEGSDNVQ